MDRQTMLDLVRYQTWANDRIMTTAVALSGEELRRTGTFDHGTAFQTLRHVVDSEWGWRVYLEGKGPEGFVWEMFALEDLSSIRSFCTEEDARFEAFVAVLDDVSLHKSIQIGPRLDGSDVTRPLWFVLMHVLNHGTHHRSELARYFTDCGYSPDDLDLIGVPYPPEG